MEITIHVNIRASELERKRVRFECTTENMSLDGDGEEARAATRASMSDPSDDINLPPRTRANALSAATARITCILQTKRPSLLSVYWDEAAKLPVDCRAAVRLVALIRLEQLEACAEQERNDLAKARARMGVALAAEGGTPA